MNRWTLVSLLAFGAASLAPVALAPALALDRAIPNLDYTSTCRATPPVAMDQKQTFDSCINDEKQAKKDLPAEWGRSKAEWRESCVRQTTLGGLASYVELITCLEMHDPNPPSLNRPGVSLPGASTTGSSSPAQPGATAK